MLFWVNVLYNGEYQDDKELFSMKNFESLNAWAISALHQFGFHKFLKTVNAEMVVNKPLLNQELGRKSEWGGFYHLFQQGPSICLYMFNQVENKAQVIMIDSEQDLNSLLQTRETRTTDEILKESRQNALDDPRLADEKKKIEDFIAKNQKNKCHIEDRHNDGVESNLNNVELGEEKAIEDIPVTKKAIVINSVKDLDGLNLIEQSVLSESKLAKFYSLKNSGNVYTVVSESDVVVFGQKITLKMGQVLLPLNNKIHELIAVLTVSENGEVLDSVVISPRPQTVNCYTLGDVHIENNKWVFIASDLISGLIIKSETDVSVLVCEDEDSINDLIADLRNRFKVLKIGRFLDGKLTMNQTITVYKQDVAGVYYFNIIPDFQGEPKWSIFIVAQRSNADFSLQALIKKEVKLQTERVNKLQTIWC